jgi:hypothetical protein
MYKNKTTFSCLKWILHSVLSPNINYSSHIHLFYLVNLHIKLAFWNMLVCWKVVVKDDTSSLQAI